MLNEKNELCLNWKALTIIVKYAIVAPLKDRYTNFMKTNKSFAKRIKVTKNGKLVARKPGQNHFNARQTGQQRLRRKRTQLLNLSKRITRRFLPGTGAKPLSETNPVVEAK